MSIRALVRRTLAASALLATLGVLDAAAAHEPVGERYVYTPDGYAYGRIGACVVTAAGPGRGYRDMLVRFDALERREPTPSQVALGPGPGYRDSWVRLPQEPPTLPGTGYRDALVRFNRLSSGPNAIASSRCFYSL